MLEVEQQDWPMVEREDGSLVLQTNSDPAGAGHRVVGYKRFAVGLDVGGRGEDPSALVVLKSESRPYMTGRGWEQALTPPEHTIVYTETAKLGEATDVVDWVVGKLRQLKNWRFGFDATGMGAPLASLFEQAKVPAHPVVMTAGAAISRDGHRVRVSKNLLLENAATCFENGSLRVASDLPDKEALIREITSVEFKTTSAGNMTLQSAGKGHHADRFIAASIALLVETHLAPRRVTFGRIENYFG
ncbi:MAG: hypothetical protein AAGK02_06650 [Pseudomonadota bacterium]